MVVRIVAAIAVLWMLTTGLCSSYFLFAFIREAQRPYARGDGFKIGWDAVPIPAASLIVGVGSGYAVYRWSRKRK